VFVEHVESLKATSLIHAAKNKLLNSTTTSTTTEVPQKDRLAEMLAETPEDQADGVVSLA
jgi:hypothetical protein